MKRKYIFIINIILVILLIIPIVTLANKKSMKYDEDGNPVIYSTEEAKNLPAGTKYSLAVPSDDKFYSQAENENNTKEKEEFEIMSDKPVNVKATTSDDGVSIASEKIEEIYNRENLDNIDNIVSVEDKELEDKLLKFMEIFKKYYGVEYSENLFNNVNKEIDENSNIPGNYKIPESSKRILKQSIDLYNNTEITNDEKEIIRCYLEVIDTQILGEQDMELCEELQRTLMK